jgi:hypothetical protein
MFMPKSPAAATNQAKLEIETAYAANSTAATADSEARLKLLRRPIARMSIVAGIVVDATLMTMTETGRVASAGFSESLLPMMPPSVTTMIEPVADMSWHVVRSKMLRARIGL